MKNMEFNIQALREALRASILLDLAKIEKIPDVCFPNSDDFLQSIYERHENEKKIKNHLSGRRIVAIIIAAMLIIASAVTVVAYREKLLDFFETKMGTHTSLTAPNKERTNEKIKEVYSPTYVPDNYTFKSRNVTKPSVVTYWNCEEKTIRLKQTIIVENERTLNTEDGNYVEAVFGNQPIYYIVKHNTFSGIWHTDDYIYDFSAPYDIGLEEIEKIIASICFEKEIE